MLCFVMCLSFCGWMLILYVHRWWDWPFGWCEWLLFSVKHNLRWWIRVRVQGNCHLSLFVADGSVLLCEIEGEFADEIHFHKLCADEFLDLACFVALLWHKLCSWLWRSQFNFHVSDIFWSVFFVGASLPVDAYRSPITKENKDFSRAWLHFNQITTTYHFLSSPNSHFDKLTT